MGHTLTAFALLLSVAIAQPAQHEKATYQMPPDDIAALIDAPQTPATLLSPNKKWLLLMDRPSLPPIADLSGPELRLAGVRINPANNGRSRRSYYSGLAFMRMADGYQLRIKGLPKNAKIDHIQWAPDNKKIAFTITHDDGIDLWIADVALAHAKPFVLGRLNATYARPFRWVSDSKSFVCTFVPDDRGPLPTAPSIPTGPTVQENISGKAPARTYQDLLKNAYDQTQFDYYFRSQVVNVTLSGAATKIGQPGVIASARPAPGSHYVLIETLHRPYSYIVPASRFPRLVEVFDMKGNLMRQVADLPLAENVPVGFGAVPTGPRAFRWRSDVHATLYWAEAQDGGDPRKDAEVRDIVYVLPAPFNEDPDALVSLGLRYSGVQWCNDKLALVSEWWWKTRKQRSWMIDPSRPGYPAVLLIDHSWEDRYTDPGTPIMTTSTFGTPVLMTDETSTSFFYHGVGASPEGNKPFLDRLVLFTKKPNRLWQSQAPYYEYPVDLLDFQRKIILTRRESVTEPPNYFVRNYGKDTLRRLTEFPHPTPQLLNVQKELIRYKRDDGVKLTATLYLPAGYKKSDGPLPMLMWAYPQEFKSAAAAGQLTESPYRFIRVSTHSPLLWLVHGYAILDDPSLPIIGEGDQEPNDTYIQQLVAGAKAAVDEVVRRGVADPNRIAIGGHSYGAFMTANLLAHSDLFCAGIARSGAYNRTLTPFGFQAEERTFWEAPNVYFEMSPFMHADKINEPILLIHGEADNNSGTFPIQSKRFYSALKGHGATVRLVMLPKEAHGYRSRESVMHMAWEMTEWLDRYVKNAPRRTKPSTQGTQ